MFQRCGEQWRRRYLDEEVIPPGIAARVGSGVHKAAEINFRSKMQTGEDMPLDAVRDAAAEAYDKALSAGVFFAPDEVPGAKIAMAQGKDDAVSLATLFRRELAPAIMPALPISSVTRESIAQIAECMGGTGVKPVTVRRRLSVLKTVLRWSAEKGYCSTPDFPKLPAGGYEKFIPPTTEEIAEIMSVASNQIIRAVILGAQLGVRVGQSEMLQLTWDDVDLDQGVLRVHGSKKNLNMPWREVPIRRELVEVFMEWKLQDETCGAHHLINFKGRQVKSIKTAWKAALRRAGIKRRIRPYDLRHAFGTELVAADVDVGTVAKLMGHSTPMMLLNHYQYVAGKQKREAVERLPRIVNVPRSMCPKLS